MGFACSNYEQFLSGQCTAQLLDDNRYQFCFGPDSNNTAYRHCPIRMGLNSIDDYRRLFGDVSNVTDSLVYFMQTNDRTPFCQFHYNVKLIIRFNVPPRYYRGYRSRSLMAGDWFSNGKLLVNIVGTRGKANEEIELKSDSSENINSIIDNTGSWIKDYDFLLSNVDIGTILRVELEWKVSTPSQRSLMMPVQTKALRRWLPQLPELSSVLVLPTVLGDLQRTLNATSQTVSGPLRSLSNQLNEIINSQPYGAINKMSKQLPVEYGPLIKTEMSWNHRTPKPQLDAVTITKLETNHQKVYCVTENEIQTLFLPKRTNEPNTAILIDGKPLEPEYQGAPIDKLLRKYC